MSRPTDIGRNATGGGATPERVEVNGERAAKASEKGVHDVEEARAAFALDAGVIGSMPRPPGWEEVPGAAGDAEENRTATAFVDKLGERGAFERTGIRLYEALLAKHDAFGSLDGGPSRARLEEMRDEEIEHYAIVEDAIVALGGDPTMITPSGDMAGVEEVGLVQVITDPRTTMGQCLHALLVAELTDSEGWRLLVELAMGTGHETMAAEFRRALAAEERHVADARRWLAASSGLMPEARV